MRVGFFTDTYFPQVSGVATSIKTLKEELEKKGHQVYIFTTTDPHAPKVEQDIIRMPSVPFVSFKERRVIVRGMWEAYRVAKELQLDLIHTHTEFGAGILGQMVAKKLHIPAIHTYHTMYEDYLHYIANGKVVRQSQVKFLSRLFANHATAVVCPSERVINTLRDYGVVSPMRVIPTGIEIQKFERPDITKEMTNELRQSLNIADNDIMILSLSRISYEKNIQALIKGFPQIVQTFPRTKMVIVGKGPYKETLEEQVATENLTDYVSFIGEVPNEGVALYYHAADYFISASTSETQGLTYTEAMAAGTPLVVEGNDYLNHLISDPSLGVTFEADTDFASAFINYVQAGIPANQEVLDQKLYEISATHFGETMLQFYFDILDYYREKEITKDLETTTEKIKTKLTSFTKKTK